MLTVTIDIINEKALSLLRNLEQLKLIHLRKEKEPKSSKVDWLSYKGAMSKEPLSAVNKQLEELRNEWD